MSSSLPWPTTVLTKPEEISSWSSASDLVSVDFETFYTDKVSVKRLGFWAYTHHPEFAAELVSVCDGPTAIVCKPSDFPWHKIAGRQWVSHVREFDAHVFEKMVEDGQVGAEHRPSMWWCSASASAFLQLPRDLAGAVNAVFNITLDKGVRSRQSGKHWDSGLFGLDPEVIQYAALDAIACRALWLAIEKYWPRQERQLFEITAQIGRRGINVEWAYVEASIVQLTAVIESCKAMLPWEPAGSVPKFRAWCVSEGFEVPESTADASVEFDEWLDRNLQSQAATHIRTMQRLRSANRMVKVMQSMKARRRPDGRMAFSVKYFGANTGRWSAENGLNLQNQNRKPVEGVDQRRSLIPAPGHTFVIVDYAQIESRVLLWIVGDEATLELIRPGKIDLYEAHARATMGYNDERPLKKVDPGMRQLAKARVLGLGFGCGAEKFAAVAKVMADLDLTPEECKKTVDEYRASNPKVVRLWARLDAELKSHAGGKWCLPLPATSFDPKMGRYLIYRNIRSSGECTIGGQRKYTYGGKVCENLVQGAARDLLASATIRCVRAGFMPVLTVHDELVFEIPTGQAEQAKAEIIRIMEEPRPWFEGLPLKAEASISDVYCK